MAGIDSARALRQSISFNIQTISIGQHMGFRVAWYFLRLRRPAPPLQRGVLNDIL
jgi:hypothetical protein